MGDSPNTDDVGHRIAIETITNFHFSMSHIVMCSCPTGEREGRGDVCWEERRERESKKNTTVSLIVLWLSLNAILIGCVLGRFTPGERVPEIPTKPAGPSAAEMARIRVRVM